MEFVKRYLDNIQIDFTSKRYAFSSVSAVLVVLSWLVFALIGPNWGIDFTGGTEIHLQFDQPTEISEMRSALAELGLSNDAVQAVNGDDSNEYAIRIQDASFGTAELESSVKQALINTYGEDWISEMKLQAEVGARFVIDYTGEPIPPQEVTLALTGIQGVQVQSGKEETQVVVTVPGLASQIQKNIAAAMGDKEFTVLSIDAVGPKVGGDLWRQGLLSIAATLGLVLLYVAFRFDVGFAPGAIAALFHDVSLTIGIFVIAQLEFSLPMIGALLTIVGYSLNDTIVIYDRIRENKERHRREDLAGLINTSISETLTRTVATSVTTLLAITALMIIGGPVIRNFAFAMCLGIIFGTYSTVFVASPMILIMEDVKPWLSKFVALQPADSPDEGDDDDADPESLSASEQRRRERAENERRLAE